MPIVNNLDPILFELGPLEVRWYGLLFALGIMIYYFVALWVFKKKGHKVEDLDSLVIYLFIGLIVGARLGHIFFYEADYYLARPLEMLYIWKGGLASHGAAIGLFLMYCLWCKRHKAAFAKHIDAIAIPIGITSLMVRLGNYFNSEIVGVPSGSDYGVVFARLNEDFARHPAQLYEGVMGFCVFLFLFFTFRRLEKKGQQLADGSYLAWFLILYFGGRTVTEIWKARHVIPESFPLSMGQILSLIGVALGVFYLQVVKRREVKK